MSTTIHQDLLPYNAEAEQAVLGAIMLSAEAIHKAHERGLTADQFFDHRHRAIWTAVSELAARRHPIDLVTVFQQLKDRAEPMDFGGLEYLNAIAQCVPSATNMWRHIELMQDKAMRRALLEVADQAQNIAVEPEGSAADKVDKVAALVNKLSVKRQKSEPRALGELIAERTTHWEALEDGSAPKGTPTHIPALDNALGGGLKPGKLIIIGARPGVGKSSLSEQVCLAVAAQGRGVLLLSQEMTAGELVDRAASNLGRVNLGSFATGRFADGAWGQITEAMEAASSMPLFIEDEPGLNLMAICAKARSLKRRRGLSLLVLDYLQLCTGTNPRDNRNQQIEELSRGLKVLAKELDITVIALSQLSRKSTERTAPDLADLRDSGSIEQDADMVILLHQKERVEGSPQQIVQALIPKNRQGPRGSFLLEFYGSTQRWEQASGTH